MRTSRLAFAFALVALVAGGAGLATAHPGDDHPPDMRVWKDADGLFEIEASFVLARGDEVQLLRHDGKAVWVPLAKLSRDDQSWVRARVEAIRRINGADAPGPLVAAVDAIAPPPSSWRVALAVLGVAGAATAFARMRRRLAFGSLAALVVSAGALGTATATQEKPAPAIQKHFEGFKAKLTFRVDDDYFYVGSNGLPDHPMLGGIRAWNQQVPLPQPYMGANAFRIPLRPRFAEKPISGKVSFFKGAIAVAVNGVPIFNPIKQDGRTDTFLGGELDEFGGHCGRADDYHYHIGPLHLEKVVGKGNPIGYALDGFPLLGYTDADGNEPKDLDAFNGRTEKDGSYRYYSTKTYPYVNGGLKGVIEVRDGEVAVQPRAAPIRPFLPGLRGAVKIEPVTLTNDPISGVVKYVYQGKSNTIQYKANPNGSFAFTFVDDEGKQRTETYERREGKGGKKDEGKKKDDGKKKDEGKKKEEGKKKKDDGGERRPWLSAHFDELDADQDGVLTADELKAEVARVFEAYDVNKDGKLTKDEYGANRVNVKSAMAGFVRGHADEIDANGDGVIVREELSAVMMRMFERADRTKSGRIRKADVEGKK